MPRSGAPFATAGATCSLSSRNTFAKARVRAAVTEEKAREETRSGEEAARLRQRWPTEFRDGARGALLMRFDGQREPGGYPLGFNGWPLERRNAWFAGFNGGFHDLLRLLQEPR
jgi:hypothetical protein